MIILYCYDIEKRIEVHNYFRDLGLTIEASAPREFRLRGFAADAEALLIVGDTPPGYIATLNLQLPIFNVGRYQLGDAFHFREYTDPRLAQMLSAFSSDEPFFSYNDILFGKTGRVLFLGYDMKLNSVQRSILHFLVKNKDRSVPSDELIEVCFGDTHKSHIVLSKEISRINAKAFNIGGRRMICSPARGYYRIKKYI
ncbi:MAG: hypothetical protein J6S71_05400 [Clostridia bacterium]|nr:hypothetical protein [Clostridia bacterium]